jgi:hypothetical protein
MKANAFAVTMKFRGYFVTKTGADAYALRGRGERRTINHAELLTLANARPKKKQVTR